MNIEKRMDELETKFMIQDDLIFELNKIITEQQFSIDKLNKTLKALQNHIEAGDSKPRELKDEIPPHY